MLSLISTHLLAYFLSIRIKASPARLALAVLPALWTQVSPLTGTPTWTTCVIWKSSPLAATSVAIRMFTSVDDLNFSNFLRRCFCCMWECKLTTCMPKDSMKYCILLQALMVLENTMTFEPVGSSLRQQTIRVILSISPSVKQTRSTSLQGRNRSELRSMIFGFQENWARESKAFSLGIDSQIFSSSYFQFLPLLLFFPNASFSLVFLLSFLSPLFSFHYYSVLAFLMKYLVPLNSRVRVAETKKILLFNLPKKLSSASVRGSSFTLASFGSFGSFNFSFLPLAGFSSSSPVKVNKLQGSSMIWSVGKELRLRLSLTFFPFYLIQNSSLTAFSSSSLLIFWKSFSKQSVFLGMKMRSKIQSISLKWPISIILSASSMTKYLRWLN